MSGWSHVKEKGREATQERARLAPKKKLRIARQNRWGAHRFAGVGRVPRYPSQETSQ